MTTPTTTSRNPAGRTPEEFCRHGHPLAITRRRRRGDGDSYCIECKRSRNRAHMRLGSHVKQMERLLRDGLSTTSGGFREWQQRVWMFFEAVEAKAAAKATAGYREGA